MTTRIKLRRDTANNWSTVNPVLALGEPGLETDTRKVKYGDGTTAWNSLAYATAGVNGPGYQSIAIGDNAGTNQGQHAIAIGAYAGETDQGSVGIAIGEGAGNTGQGEQAIAIGRDAGNNDQGWNGIAIGRYAGRNSQGEETVAIGRYAGNTNQEYHAIAVGDIAGETNQGWDAIAIGKSAGNYHQQNDAVAIGHRTGEINQGSMAVAVGYHAGHDQQSDEAVAVGAYAGEVNQKYNTVAVGRQAGQQSQESDAVAIGRRAGQFNQQGTAISVGAYAGQYGQGEETIAIGPSAANGIDSVVFTAWVTSGSNLLTTDYNLDSIVGEFVGPGSYVWVGGDGICEGSYITGIDTPGSVYTMNNNAFDTVNYLEASVSFGGQGYHAIAIGAQAGEYFQQWDSIAIGKSAGNGEQGPEAVAIGHRAGQNSQGARSIAIGKQAGDSSPAEDTISIGTESGYQANIGSIAIGKWAGWYDNEPLGDHAIAIGTSAAQEYGHDNSIILNASGSILNSDAAGFYVNPVRTVSTGSPLYYDATTNEITHGGISHYSSTVDASPTSATVIDLTNSKVFLAPSTGIHASYSLADGLYDGQTITFYPEWSSNTTVTDVANIFVYLGKIFDPNTANGQYSSGSVNPWYPFVYMGTGSEGSRSSATATWNAHQNNWVVDPWNYD